MNELVKEYFKVFPWFFDRYLAIVTGPTRFATSKSWTTAASTKDSLKFFAGAFLVTMLIGFFVVEDNIALARELLFQLVVLMPMAAFLTLAWKLAKVPATYKPTLLLLLYFFGAFLPIFPIGTFLMKGMQKVYGDHGFQTWGFITFFVMAAWGIACWNAYREFFKATASKAIAAGVIALGFMALTFQFAKLLLAGVNS